MVSERNGRRRETVDFAPSGPAGLPCDLPQESGHVPGISLPPVSRPARIALVVALAMVLAALVAAIVVDNAPKSDSGVFSAAVSGVEKLASTAGSTADDVKGRAERGEGLVSGVVCIDAGHGGGYDLTLTPIGPGSDEMQYVEPGGTSGVVTGVDEAVVTLQVAELLKAKLEDKGITVVMVREDNETVLSSEQRAQIANSCGADLFIRLHCDGSDYSEQVGFTTLVPGYNDWTWDIVDSSAYAAQIMHPIIIAGTGAVDDGIVQRSDLAGFNFCDVPSVLFEMGFMSNPEEDVLLNDPGYQDLLAQSMCDAAIEYLKAVSD